MTVIACSVRKYGVTDKTCKGCGLVLPEASFNVAYLKRDGSAYRRAICPKCYVKRGAESLKKNPEARRAYICAWRRSDRGRAITAAAQRRHRAKPETKAKSAARYREYAARARDRLLLMWRLKSARRRVLVGDPRDISTDLISSKLLAQAWRCVYCLTDLLRGYHLDHATPVSRGGNNDPDNLQLLCPPCNISKRDKTHDEYLAWRAAVRAAA